jgi:oxaloacetate decarboxylase beta subunit
MDILTNVLLYFAIVKKCEPLLLLPISFGAILVNLPLTGIMEEGGLLYFISWGIKHEVYPCLIFMGIGAMTDFGPLLANPITFLLGAAAQVGVFVALIGSVLLGFTIQEAGSIGIIGGADGPTAIYLAVKMAPQLLGAIAVAAYSYMSLVPIIQPPIMKLLTTVEERKIVNLFRESLVVNRLSNTAQNELINIVTIFLATSVGATMQAEYFLTFNTIKIILLGLIAFAFGTAGGVLFAKLLNKITGGKINPLIGAAGVSAVPMAARVAQKVGQEANPSNFLLMHAMGPNVAGVIGTAVAAGVMLTLLQ